MSKKQKRMLKRILVSAVLFVICVLLPVSGWPRLLAFLVPYGVMPHSPHLISPANRLVSPS